MSACDIYAQTVKIALRSNSGETGGRLDQAETESGQVRANYGRGAKRLEITLIIGTFLKKKKLYSIISVLKTLILLPLGFCSVSVDIKYGWILTHLLLLQLLCPIAVPIVAHQLNVCPVLL